jgi:hypothetical protein
MLCRHVLSGFTAWLRNDKVLDWIFLAVTGFVAYHALTHRNEDGEKDIGHMLFGYIALSKRSLSGLASCSLR